MGFGDARPHVELAGAEKLGNETRWISVAPAHRERARRRILRAFWIAPLILAVAGALVYFVFGVEVLADPGVRLRLGAMGAALLAYAALAPILARRVRKKLEQYRLGASKSGLSYEIPKD